MVIPSLLPLDEDVKELIPMGELAINIAAVVIPAIVGSFCHWIAVKYGGEKGKKIINILSVRVKKIRTKHFGQKSKFTQKSKSFPQKHL